MEDVIQSVFERWGIGEDDPRINPVFIEIQMGVRRDHGERGVIRM